MTYYVQKNVFTAGDVADADNLMEEFYRAAGAVSSIDQNNLAVDSIHPSVVIPPDPQNTSDRQRGPFACYDDDSPVASGLLYTTGGTLSAGNLTNNIFTDYVNSDFELRFTTRVPATYHFFFQATVAIAATDELKLDAVLMLNGSPAGGLQVSVSTTGLVNPNSTPLFIRASQFLEPSAWHVTPSFRPRVDGATMPSIEDMAMGVVGFIR